MKTTGFGKAGVAKILILALIIVFSLTALYACNKEGTVESISIVDESVRGYYAVGDFDITTVRLLVTYEDESTNEIAAQLSMLNKESRGELTTAGEKHLTVYYKGKTVVLDIVLVEAGTDIVSVEFKNLSGTTIATKYTVVGGNVELVDAPEVEGMVFNGWENADGYIVTSLSGLTASTSLTATYLTVANSYSVRFVDYKGTVLRTATKNAGDTVKESDAPSVSLASAYPELSNFSWGVTFPYKVTSDVTIQMSPIYKKGTVLFAYAIESDASRKIYVDEFATSVMYGDSVSGNATKMEAYLTRNSYEILTPPTQSTTINLDKDGQIVTFVYVVRDASVTVKLYADSEKSTPVAVKSPLKIGEALHLDAKTAASVTGNVLSGWKIIGKDAQGKEATVFVSADEPTWVVTRDLGLSVEIIPTYKILTVPVEFAFVFGDDKLANDDSSTYELTLTVNDVFALGDVVSYVYIDNLLQNIQDNVEDYVKILGGTSVPATSAAIRNAQDNSSSDRATALSHVGAYRISTVNVDAEILLPGGSKVIVEQNTLFTVTVSGETKGLRYEEITGGYAVTGFTAEYVAGSNVFIPATHENKPVLAIADGALRGMTVTALPDGLTTIGDNALKEAVIYGDLRLTDLVSVGEGAFAGATLTGTTTDNETVTVIVLGGVETLSKDAFNGLIASNVSVFLGEGTTSIGMNAFKDAAGLRSVSIPSTVTSIGAYAFSGTKLDTFATYDGEETVASAVTNIGSYAFEGTLLEEIDFPKLQTLGAAGAFANMNNLTAVSLGTEAASSSLVVNMDNFTDSTSIVAVAFGAYLTDVTDVSGVLATLADLRVLTVAADNANYYTHENVLYAIVGDDYYTAYYPNDKTGSYKAVVPEGKKVVVEAEAFAAASVAVLDFSGVTVKSVGASVTDTVFAVVIADDFATAARAAFVGATVAATVEDAAFYYEDGLVYKLVTTGTGDEAVTTATVMGGYRRATEITVPATLGNYDVTAIADDAFAGFAALTKLVVNATVADWNRSILEGDAALVEFSVKGFANRGENAYAPALDAFEGNGWYDTHNVIFVGGKLIGYNNVAMVNGRPFTTVSEEDAKAYFGTAIPAEFFKGQNVTEIHLPAEVKAVNESAFEGSNLEVFTAVGLTVLGKEAFKDCLGLEEIEITFTGAASMSDSVFVGCRNLKSATLNGAVNSSLTQGVNYYYLPAKTFLNCAALENVSFSHVNAFGKIGGESGAFQGCEALTTFDFASLVQTEIPASTFASSGLDYVVLTGTAIEEIGDQAFNTSSLRYLQLTSYVTKIGTAAFKTCDNLVVELSYDNGGLYAADAEIGENAFHSDAIFFVSQSVDVDNTPFLKDFVEVETPKDAAIGTYYEEVSAGEYEATADLTVDGSKTYYARRKYSQTYPTTDFRLTTAVTGLTSFNKTVMTKILLLESDLTAPEYEGYIFAGWFRDEDEVNPASFPLVLSESATLYAKYYNSKQGSVVATTDVKYVFYISELPVVSVDSGETVTWTYQVNGADNGALSAPAVIAATADSKFTLVATVKDSMSNIVRTEYFEEMGTLGYAIVGYSYTNPERMYVPDTYDDGENGEADIIAVFAGAFENCIPAEFVLPTHTKAVFLGSGAKSTPFNGFATTGTFGAALKTVTIPAGVEYIQDGVFASETIEDVIFEEGSNLIIATQSAFLGSAWWSKQLAAAKDNDGFVVAGRLAVKYVGMADVLVIDPTERQYTVSSAFGFAETTEAYSVYVTAYMANGEVRTTVVNLNGTTTPNDSVYLYADVDASAIGLGTFTFVLNSEDTHTWAYAKGRNTFIFDDAIAGGSILAISVTSTKDTEVSVPAGVIKLGDSIFELNTDMNTIVLNKELTTIGDRAFYRSGLANVRYGIANNEQYLSSVKNVGTNAFAGTSWWLRTEKVILGTLFLKYNNVSGATSMNVTENITKIADSAFRGAQLTSVNVSSATLTEIGAYAFKGSAIGTIALPKSVSKIGRGAFESCLQLTGANLSVTTIDELPERAFMNAVSLSVVLLPATVKKLGKDALTGCARLSGITADGIVELVVAGNRYESGLSDTEWYSASGAAEEADDTILRLGNVLVRYVVGTDNRAYKDEAGQLKVTIPSDITMVAYNAFSTADSAAVTEIEIPASVKEIGPYAFVGCINLTRVDIGENVVRIGEHAFDGLTSLQEAVLPDGLVAIGDYAFKNTALKTEVLDENGVRVGEDEGYTIPASVKEIGVGAFYGVSTLTVVNLGSKIVSLGANAFNVTGSNAVTVGNLYKVNWALDINVPTDEDAESDKAPIEALATYLSSTYPGNESVNIFKTGSEFVIRFYADEDVVEYVQTRGRFSGYDFWAKEGWNFFADGSYPEVTFTNNGYTMPVFNSEYIVEGDAHIAEPPHNTESGGTTYTFMNWVVVVKNGATVNEELTYPYIVTSDIQLEARFYTNEYDKNSERMGSVTDDNGVTFTFTDGTNAIAITGISGAGDVLYIPNKIHNKPVTSINVTNDTVKKLILTSGANFNGMTTNVFSAFTALESIVVKTVGTASIDYKVIPTTLTAKYDGKTYESTFYAVYSNDTASSANYGTKLIAVVGNVDAASKAARDDYREEHVGVSEATISGIMLDYVFSVPDGVVEIYSNAFKNAGFKTVALSDKVSVIGDDAFGPELAVLRISRGIAISDVTYKAIPQTSPIMNANAGNQVVAGTYIEINGLASANGNSGTFYALGNVLLAYKTSVLEYGSLVLPNAVNGIDITVLASNLNVNGSTITANTITLPTNVQKINTEAFTDGDVNFSDVLNADNYARLREVASGVFSGTDFYKNNSNNDSGIYVGKILIRFNTADDQSQIRSDTVAIASNAFMGSRMTRITIPDSVRSIGSYAFYGCTNLTEVTIPNSVTSIGESAFGACKNLTTINVDAINSTLESIGKSAFASDVSLRLVRLPYGLKSLGDEAFRGCTSLEVITFDGYDAVSEQLDTTKLSGLTYLGASAFSGCTSLTAISIPEGVATIQSNTFTSCTSLATVSFARNSKLKSIESYAFSGCVKLGSVLDTSAPDLVTLELPSKLVSVGTGAFENCSGLWGVRFLYNINMINSYAFSGCNNLVKMEFARDTAPQISGTIFGDDQARASANYRIRIYVNPDPNHEVRDDEYVAKWSSVWSDCAKYIYEKGENPTITYTYTTAGGVTSTISEQKDVVFNPIKNLGGSDKQYWIYESITQNGESVTTDSRLNKFTSQYNTSAQTVTIDGITYAFIVVDYDEIVVRGSDSQPIN